MIRQMLSDPLTSPITIDSPENNCSSDAPHPSIFSRIGGRAVATKSAMPRSLHFSSASYAEAGMRLSLSNNVPSRSKKIARIIQYTPFRLLIYGTYFSDCWGICQEWFNTKKQKLVLRKKMWYIYHNHYPLLFTKELVRWEYFMICKPYFVFKKWRQTIVLLISGFSVPWLFFLPYNHLLWLSFLDLSSMKYLVIVTLHWLFYIFPQWVSLLSYAVSWMPS